MALRRFSSRLVTDVYYFYDDFVGSNWDNRWWSGRGTGGGISTQADSVVRVRANANLTYEMYQTDKCDFSVAANAIMTSRYKLSHTTSIQGEIGFEAASPDNSNNWITLYYDSSVGANWQAQSASAGTPTTVDTGIAADTNFHEFRIETTSSKITYFLDGTLAATITTNIPTMLLQPYVFVVSKTGSARDVIFDWIEAVGERET